MFARGAGARRVESTPAAPGVPQATPEQIRWNHLKARAARWFARLEQEQVRTEQPAPAPLAAAAVRATRARRT